MVCDVVARYRTEMGKGNKKLSYRKLAGGINQELQPHPPISYAALCQWEKGNAQPDYWLLVFLAGREGWPGALARDLLREMKPEIWGAVNEQGPQ